MPITVLTGETTAITSGVTTITDLVSQVWTIMTGNPLVMVLLVLHSSALLSVLSASLQRVRRKHSLVRGGQSAPHFLF